MTPLPLSVAVRNLDGIIAPRTDPRVRVRRLSWSRGLVTAVELTAGITEDTKLARRVIAAAAEECR